MNEVRVTFDTVIEGFRASFDDGKLADLAEVFHARFLEVAKQADRLRRKKKKTPEQQAHELELLREAEFFYRLYYNLRPADSVGA